jgi:integrase/recombinase XerD
LEASGLSPHTVSAYLVVVRLFFEWAEKVHLFPNVARDIKGGKTPRGHCRDCLTVTQVRKLLDGAERSTLRGKRDFAILNLLVRTGLRTIEIVRADLGDIRSDSGEVFLWIRGKGRDAKDEFVVLTHVSADPINEYLAVRGPVENSAPLFASIGGRNRNGRLTTRSVRRSVKDCFRRVGINSRRLTTHSLRHTAITLALLGGASVQEVQLLARHSSINTTMLYAHNLNRVANAPERRIDAMLDAGV